MKSILLAAVAAAAIAGPAAASVTAYADRTSFDAAAGPIVTETFEACSGTVSAGTNVSLSSSSLGGVCGSIQPGVTFSPVAGYDNYIAAPGQSANPTTALGVDTPNGGAMTIAFAGGSSSFATDLFQNFGGGEQSGSDASFTINAYDSLNGLLGAWTFPVASGTGGFFGITSTTSIYKVTVAQAGGYAVVDNVSFGGKGAVPEPATWAMMIAGFGLAGVALRRRAVPAHA